MQIVQIDDETYHVDGMFPIDEFNSRFGAELPDDDYHTLAGFVFGQLGRAPQPGDDVSYDGMRFDVLDVDGNRIERVAVNFLERPTPRRGGGELQRARRRDRVATLLLVPRVYFQSSEGER